ncbi:hypothetical protein SCE1572_09095 [Sorangium cellulosum So0157-2]|nr:hypothetical protein SCE1572_09095 [Sorangium cellulosum So0157-2]
MNMEMNMNKMGKLVLSALSVLGITACAASSTEQAEVVGESQDALVTCNGTVAGGFFGSDTLYNAMQDALAGWGVGGLTYLGTGSSNGERCLRGSAAVTCGGVTYCNGTSEQMLAPMSRDFSTCQAGEKSNPVALDAVALWTKSTQTATNVTTVAPVPAGLPSLPVDKVKGAFCGDGSGSAASCALTDTWGEFAVGSSSPSNALKLYRRDDVSGTTEVFKQKTGCNTFCASVKVVVDDTVAGPRLSTDAAGTSSLVSAGTCAASDSATVCLGKIAASDVNVVAYAGLDASNANNKRLSVDGVAPSTANVRALVTSPSTAYKYSRFVYLNEGNGGYTALQEDFLAWALGRAPYGPSEAELFEDAFENNGFIRCKAKSDPSYAPLACGAGLCL